MKVAIVGSRGYHHIRRVHEFVRTLDRSDEVVSGGAPGVDRAAVWQAMELHMKTKVFPADWEQHGKAAGVIRNTQIVEYADRVVAFWDGHSRGTLDTVNKARAAGKPVSVITEENPRGELDQPNLFS